MVNVGIIGCGAITKVRHAPEYRENPHACIHGFFDPRADRAREMSKEFGGKVYDSYEKMLDDKEIDAVSVNTSNKYHSSITIQALEAGKHVLCEKPMAVSLEECEQMVAAAQKNNRYLMIGHNQRLAPAHRRAKEILLGGELGDILTFRTYFAHSGPENWSADKSANTWFFKKSDAFMGVMGDLGIHKADLIRWLIGDDIVEVMASIVTLDKTDGEGKRIEVDDNAHCILKSRRGIIGTLIASWTSYGEENNSTVVNCTNGILKIYEDPTFPIVVLKKNKEKVFYQTGKIQTNDDQVRSGVIDLFVKSILEDTTPEISGEEGLAAMKIIFACIESSQKGVAVKIK